tara:strand:+ start:72 stop:311 length:240 start_codon:yes stop_codon:yes gene_type:complete
MKNLVSHQTTKQTVNVLYRVVMPSTFSNSNHATIQDAIKERDSIGEGNSQLSDENKKYWEKIRNESTIVRITETSKRVV